jgi:hypothetical protein
MRWSMLLDWWPKHSCIDWWLTCDYLYSQYWSLHSGQLSLVGNLKPPFQKCWKKEQFQCNSACSLSYFSSSHWHLYSSFITA